MPLLEQLQRERVEFPRTIIYCRRMEDCSDLYLFFQQTLGREFTKPPGAPSLSRFRLVEMFMSFTDHDIKQQISVPLQNQVHYEWSVPQLLLAW